METTGTDTAGSTRQREGRPIAVDLFAGAGGMSLAFEQAGFDVVAAVEYDPVHMATHEFNFPRTRALCADVSALPADDLRSAARAGIELHGGDGSAWDGTLDVVFGGPPCQGFSSIGRRLIDDKRNRLVFHFFRLVSELRPRFFVMENVPGMARGGHASILEQMVGEFEEAGYRFNPEHHRILNAADFGVPQDRRRLFLIGAREGEDVPSYPGPKVRPVPKRRTDAAPRSDADGGALLPQGSTVWDAIGDLPNLDRFPKLLKTDEVQLSPQAIRSMHDVASPYARQLMGLERDPEDSSHLRQWDRRLLTGSMRTVHTEKSVSRFRQTAPGDTEPVSRFYRLDARGLSNTLRAGTGSEGGAFTSPRPIHPTRPRVISVREAARLHSFPDWFRLHETKWNGFRQIGNSVPPLVGRAVARQILRATGADVSRPRGELALGDRALLSLIMQQAAEHFGADPGSIPGGRRRDYRAIAQRLFDAGDRRDSEAVGFDDECILSVFRELKIRPPVELGMVPHLLRETGALVAIEVVPAGGSHWEVEVLAKGRYRFVAANLPAAEDDEAEEPPDRVAA